ncbi:MAG: hypothetical protein JWQ89_3911 [Devosia sp.]|uniref:hypothetical protein n=1 Tax=Devosia sp. TaxID=1871048 RepID=UPI0026344173|nr:hypothetical protein [Devosia sp.]MDB5542184.1 hypothetical protein [Devosia sp.]
MKARTLPGSITRRRVVVGAAASIATLALAPAACAGAAPPDTELPILSTELDRFRHRCGRLDRQVRRLAALADRLCKDRGIEAFLPNGRRNRSFDEVRAEVGYDTAWRQWSDTVSTSLDLAEHIRRTPASDVAGLAIKYHALLWELFHAEMALAVDDVHLRHLKTFGRELTQLGH